MSFTEDIKTVFEKDPAARSVPEVLLCYPGLHAVWIYRPAHGAHGGAGRTQLDHNKLPDYCAQEMRRVQEELDKLREEIEAK